MLFTMVLNSASLKPTIPLKANLAGISIVGLCKISAFCMNQRWLTSADIILVCDFIEK
jgi:hypothetical protein